MVLLSRLSWFMITLLKQKQKLPKSSKLLVRIEWIKFFCTWNVPKSGNFTPASIHQSLSLSGDSQKLASNTAMSHCLVNRLRQKAGCYQEFKKPPGNDLCNPKTVKSSAICKRYVNCEAFVLCVLNPDWPVIKNVYIYIYTVRSRNEYNTIQLQMYHWSDEPPKKNPRDLLTRRAFLFCLENGLETRREVHWL